MFRTSALLPSSDTNSELSKEPSGIRRKAERFVPNSLIDPEDGESSLHRASGNTSTGQDGAYTLQWPLGRPRTQRKRSSACQHNSDNTMFQRQAADTGTNCVKCCYVYDDPTLFRDSIAEVASPNPAPLNPFPSNQNPLCETTKAGVLGHPICTRQKLNCVVNGMSTSECRVVRMLTDVSESHIISFFIAEIQPRFSVL
jgi:hypothetical protein